MGPVLHLTLVETSNLQRRRETGVATAVRQALDEAGPIPSTGSMRSACSLAMIPVLVGLLPSCRQQREDPRPTPSSLAAHGTAAPKPNIAAPEPESDSSDGRFVDEESRRLVEDRVVHLRGEITDALANEVIAKLLFLEADDPLKPVALEIDSPGGSVTAGLAVYDTMQGLKCRVATRCANEAASMAAVLLASGANGERTALPACRVLIHEPVAEAASSVAATVSAAEQLKMQVKLITKVEEILARHTGQSLGRVRKQSRAASWMDAAEAKTFGVIDEVSRCVEH